MIQHLLFLVFFFILAILTVRDTGRYFMVFDLHFADDW